MVFCEAPPLILFLYGDLAITTRAIPSLIALPLYLTVCLFLCARRKTWHWSDPLLACAIALVQVMLQKTSTVEVGAAGLSGAALLMPFMIFMAAYAVWRLAGKKPLENWPWPRFGMLATTTILLTDIGVALLTPVAPGKVWQIGGACMKDALLVGPPFIMLVYYGLLDCRSSWVFCSNKCVKLGKCRFGMDGKGGHECPNKP